jgi:large subunit ribosomal protein L16
MLLQPRKTKYQKVHKGRIKNYDPQAKCLKHGYCGLQAIESAYIHAKQLEAARQTITRHLKRKGRVWTCVYPDVGVTKRPIQVRIGKGTGSIKYWSFRVRPGKVLFEVDGVELKEALKALNSGANKLPFQLKLIHE